MTLFHSSIKPIALLFIKTLSIYAILSVFFYCYIGITDPNGKYFSQVLADYSILKFILVSLVYPIKWILELLGNDVSVYKNSIQIAGQRGISIFHACLGLNIMIAYVSLILGYTGKKKLVFVFLGLLGVHLLNIIRMLMILLTLHTNPAVVEESHDIFNLIGYAFIIAFYVFYVNRYSTSVEK